jgi:hypothetical protein
MAEGKQIEWRMASGSRVLRFELLFGYSKLIYLTMFGYNIYIAMERHETFKKL